MSSAPFKGTDGQQQLAAEVYQLMTTQAALFAVDAPIRQSLDNLADFLAQQQKRDRDTVAKEIDAAIRENADLFTRQETDKGVLYITSRMGNYRSREEGMSHSFRQRLHEPENPLPIDDISVVVSTSRPAITTVEPVFISDYWQVQAGLSPLLAEREAEAAADLVEAVEPEVEEVVTLAEPVVAPEPVAAVAPLVEVPVVEPTPVAATPAVAPEVAKPAERVVEKPVEKPVERPVEKPAEPSKRQSDGVRNPLINVGDMTLDMTRSLSELVGEHGANLRRVLTDKIDQDPLRRIVNFGRKFYPEVSVASLGKNDMRRIRDYILEVGEPVADTQIIADLYYHNPRQNDYEGFRFSLNYRLSREKDFEFVGVEGTHLWSVKGLPTIGTKRVKASEMAQITAYLTEGYDDSLQQQSAEAIRQSGSVTRLLTFFEWEYGILPLDASIAALIPPPMLAEQRSAVLRFESPQHYTNYLTEVRYPTNNRGGWLQGLEEFFHEHLVPGALITIGRGEGSNVFTISYEEAGETTDRLLTLDEKKNKFAFANMSYFCAVDSDQVPNQQRFGKLKNLKSLPMNERRKSDAVLEHVVETAGEQLGRGSEVRYRISLDDLFVAYNVLRPASHPLLNHLLEEGERFEADSKAGSFIYTPEIVQGGNDDDEDEDEEPTSPRGGRYRYDDDDD
jgi:hypothetical protein